MIPIKRLLFASLTLTFASISFAQTPVVEQAWLRDHLPEKITAYVRVPNPMFFFSEADTALQPLHADKEYAKTVLAIKEALLPKLDALELNEQERATVDIFLSHLRSPVEVVMPEIISFSEPPTVMLATKLDYKDAKSFTEDFEKFFISAPVTIKPEQHGKGKLIIKDTPISGTYEYQPKTGKLLVVLGKDVALYQSLISTTDTTISPIARSESLIDDNGKGLLVILKPSPMMFLMLPMKKRVKVIFTQLGLHQIKEFAIGLGVANKRPKLKLFVDMPKEGLRKLLPAYSAHTDVNYQGELKSLTSISLPNEAYINDAVNIFDGDVKDYTEFKNKFSTEMGFSFSDGMALLGRNVTSFSDDDGMFFVTDASLENNITAIIESLPNKIATITKSDIDGKTITHLDLSPFFETFSKKIAKKDDTDAETHAMILSLFLKRHFYWVKEGENLIINTLPQPLIARSQRKPTGTITDFLNAQHLPNQPSFFTSMVNYRNLSQSAYYNNLRLLNSLGDLAGVPTNIMHYPTASKQKFERYGAIAFSINNNDDVLTLELSTENGLIDIVEVAQQAYSQMGSVWVIGVLSAVAIPAYQDYIIRSQVAVSIMQASALKIQISEALAQGKNSAEINDEQFQQEIEGITQSSKQIESIEINEGAIYITFNNLVQGSIRHSELVLTPEVSDSNVIDWKCSQLKPKYLPKSCRN